LKRGLRLASGFRDLPLRGLKGMGLPAKGGGRLESRKCKGSERGEKRRVKGGGRESNVALRTAEHATALESEQDRRGGGSRKAELGQEKKEGYHETKSDDL